MEPPSVWTRVVCPTCSNFCSCRDTDESKPIRKAPPATKPRLKQQTLKPKMALAELEMDAPAVFAPAVAPELTPRNAASRFVYVPATQFGAVGIGGWIARCAPRTTLARPRRAIAAPAPLCLSCLRVCISIASHRIQQVGKDKKQTTTLQFKDADGKYSKEHFQFTHVAKTFKPLS